jgi:hypothetical protein
MATIPPIYSTSHPSQSHRSPNTWPSWHPWSAPATNRASFLKHGGESSPPQSRQDAFCVKNEGWRSEWMAFLAQKLVIFDEIEVICQCFLWVSVHYSGIRSKLFKHARSNARSNLDFEKHILTFQDRGVGSSGWRKDDLRLKNSCGIGEVATQGLSNFLMFLQRKWG